MYHNQNNAIIGTWTFRRRISNVLHKSNFVAEGILTVSPSHWVETGMMNTMPFHQRYRIRMDNTFTVLFADGSTFYNLKNIHTPKCIKHICKNDVYNGIWILQEKTLTLQWKVKGPRKNYSMLSTYHKIHKN